MLTDAAQRRAERSGGRQPAAYLHCGRWSFPSLNGTGGAGGGLRVYWGCRAGSRALRGGCKGRRRGDRRRWIGGWERRAGARRCEQGGIGAGGQTWASSSVGRAGALSLSVTAWPIMGALDGGVAPCGSGTRGGESGRGRPGSARGSGEQARHRRRRGPRRARPAGCSAG